MFPVYGLAEASLAVTFPEPGSDYRWARVNRHKLAVGTAIELNPAESRDTLELMCVGRAVPYTEVRIADEGRGALAEGLVGHIPDTRRQRDAGLFRRSGGDRARHRPPMAGWTRAIWDSCTRVRCTSPAAARRSFFVNGQNYYPYDLENIAQRAPGLDLNKLVAAGVARPGAQGEELVVFVLHRGSMAEFLPTAAAVSRLINEHTGLEVAQVIPTKRIPKTTSGKVQRAFAGTGLRRR